MGVKIVRDPPQDKPEPTHKLDVTKFPGALTVGLVAGTVSAWLGKLDPIYALYVGVPVGAGYLLARGVVRARGRLRDVVSQYNALHADVLALKKTRRIATRSPRNC